MLSKSPNEDERNCKEWQPNPKQIKIVGLLLNPEDRRTKETKCQEADIAFSTLWRWMKDERFLKYMNSQIDKYTDSELPEVWRALIAQCKRGNIQAIKLYFEMKELHPEVKSKMW